MYHWEPWKTPDVENKTKVTFQEYLDGNRYHHYAGDIHFVRSALEHPMQVLKPEDAKLFVVPTLFTMDSIHRMYGSAAEGRSPEGHLERIDAFLASSPCFKRNDGADHIAPITLFSGEWIIQYAPMLARYNMVQYYDNPSYVHPNYTDKRAMFKSISQNHVVVATSWRWRRKRKTLHLLERWIDSSTVKINTFRIGETYASTGCQTTTTIPVRFVVPGICAQPFLRPCWIPCTWR